MGYAFTYPVFKYIGECKVACYTHYPTITTEMLNQVSNRVTAHNNRRRIANSPILTQGKLLYYRIFAKVPFQIYEIFHNLKNNNKYCRFMEW